MTRQNHLEKRKRSGQMFSADMILAILLFTMILMAIIWLGDFLNEKIRYNEGRRTMGILAAYAMSTLVETEGSPSDWYTIPGNRFNETEIASLGLAAAGSGGWVIDPLKLDRLVALNGSRYDELKEMLGLRGPGYEFMLTVNAQNSTKAQIGLVPELNSSNTLLVNRLALYNGSYANISLFLWERCTRGCQ